jgi:RNA polymerase sigma factor (sigma-70 family)
VTLEAVDRLTEAMTPAASLHAEVSGTDALTLEDALADERAPDPTAGLAHRDIGIRLERGLGELPPRERGILEMRFGLRGEPGLTFQEIGDRLGLSRERVRQITEQALRRLRGRPELRELEPA